MFLMFYTCWFDFLIGIGNTPVVRDEQRWYSSRSEMIVSIP